jgi:opacity protein-like surface antigen
MKKLLAVVVLCVLGMVVALAAAGPQAQATIKKSAVSTQVPLEPAQIAKLQDPAITKLQEQVATLIDQDRQKTAEIGQLKYQVTQLQTQLTQFKTSVAQDYVPVAGPGNCSGRGWTGVGNIVNQPTSLVYSWHSCKTP